MTNETIEIICFQNNEFLFFLYIISHIFRYYHHKFNKWMKISEYLRYINEMYYLYQALNNSQSINDLIKYICNITGDNKLKIQSNYRIFSELNKKSSGIDISHSCSVMKKVIQINYKNHLEEMIMKINGLQNQDDLIYGTNRECERIFSKVDRLLKRNIEYNDNNMTNYIKCQLLLKQYKKINK